jgi:hypothetical protein
MYTQNPNETEILVKAKHKPTLDMGEPVRGLPETLSAWLFLDEDVARQAGWNSKEVILLNIRYLEEFDPDAIFKRQIKYKVDSKSEAVIQKVFYGRISPICSELFFNTTAGHIHFNAEVSAFNRLDFCHKPNSQSYGDTLDSIINKSVMSFRGNKK